MSSGQDNPSGPGQDSGQESSNISTPTSPTDTRHVLGRFGSSASSQNDEYPGSYQSTDTVRRRPEALSYGI
jgi:Ca2+:H+ antiporter